MIIPNATIRRPLRSLSMLLLLFAAGVPAAAQGESAELLYEGSGGTIEPEGETRLVLRGFVGTFSAREGQTRELRYEARTRNNTRDPRAVGLWAEGQSLMILPLEGDSGEDTLIEAVVPPGFDVVIEADGSLASLSALAGHVAISGSKTDVAARGLKGSIDMRLAGGKVLVSGVGGEVVLRGAGLETTIEYAMDRIELDLQKSSLQISHSEASIEGEIQETTFGGSDISGPLDLAATLGAVELDRAGGGGVLELGDTPLVMTRTKGPLEITTEAKVEFRNHEGPLKILGYGAELSGSSSDGTLELETDGVKVMLQQVAGKLTLRGRELDVQVLNPTAELEFHTTDSSIVVKKASGRLTFESDFGSIEVQESIERVDVTSRETAVHLAGLKAPARVKAEGGDVEIAWVSLTALEESSVETDSGNVRLRLPSTGNVRVDIQAPYGEVQAEVPGVRVSEDGHSASGLLGLSRAGAQAERPTVRVRSGGDVYLNGGR